MQTTLEKNVSHTRHRATPLAATCLGLFCYPQVLLNETPRHSKGQAASQGGWCLSSTPPSPSPERHTQLETTKLNCSKEAWDHVGPFGKDSGVASPCSTASEKRYGPHFSREKVFGFHDGVPAHTTLSCSKPLSSILTKNNEVEARGDCAVGGGPMGR